MKSDTTTQPFTRQQCALYLGLDPFNDANWPVDLLDKLIAIKERSDLEFIRECRKVMNHV
jgi:hypothetical protein